MAKGSKADEALAALTDGIERWLPDPVRYMQEVINVRDPEGGKIGPATIYDHQGEALRGMAERDSYGTFLHTLNALSWPKREGKDFTTGGFACWRVACYPDQNIICLANSKQQAVSTIYGQILQMVELSDILSKIYIISEDNLLKREIRFPATGSRISVRSCNWATIQGEAIDLLLCSELAAAEDGGETYRMASSQTERHNAQVIIASQAGEPVEENPMWTLYRQRHLPHVFFSYSREAITPWARRKAEEKRGVDPKAVWEYHWTNAWAGQDSNFFHPEQIAAAAQPYRQPTTVLAWDMLRAAWGFADVPYSMGYGLDRAGVSGKGDSAVATWTARFHLGGRREQLDVTTPLEQVPLDGDEPEDWGALEDGQFAVAVETTLGDAERDLAGEEAPAPDSGDPDAVYRIVRVRIFPTGSEAEIRDDAAAGEAIFGQPEGAKADRYLMDDLAQHLWNAEKVSPTPANLMTMYMLLYRLLQEGRLWFPEGAGYDPRKLVGGVLKRQLLNFGCKLRGNGTYQWKTQSGHDDCVDSAGQSVWAAAAVDSGAGEQYSVVTMGDFVPGWQPARLGMARV